MKLWEVIKELTEDPKKEFEAKMLAKDWTVRMSVDTKLPRYFKLEVFNGKKLIDQSLNGGGFNGNVALNLDWQLVRQPVTWQEAIQAWADGNTIRLAMPGWEQVWRPTNAVELNQCRIKDGTWYVED